MSLTVTAGNVGSLVQSLRVIELSTTCNPSAFLAKTFLEILRRIPHKAAL
jgi:hypothetical protein